VITAEITAVRQDLAGLSAGFKLLADLSERNLGIERIWPARADWVPDGRDGLKQWHARVASAQLVDIASNTFWNNWLKSDEFVKNFFANIQRGAKVRILTYDPNSEAALRQAREEGERRRIQHDVQEVKSEILQTLDKLAEERAKLTPPEVQHNLEVRLIPEFPLRAQVVRADAQMLVAIYLSGKTGSHALTFQLSGLESALFKANLRQFDFLWNDPRAHAREVSNEEIERILKAPTDTTGEGNEPAR
jgi:hypothetical protein